VNIPSSVQKIGNAAFTGCGFTSLDFVPSTVTIIGDFAFANCPFSSITIPANWTIMGKSVFYSCSNLTSVIISDNVTTIPVGAFSQCGALTSVTIPNSVNTIQDIAFQWCVKLASITIPDGVTTIGVDAFSRCDELASVTIGSGIESINSGAFAYCKKLQDVFCYAEEVPNTYINIFDETNPKNITLHVQTESIALYTAAEPWSGLKGVTSLETLEISKCATPQIIYSNSKLTFTCDTPDVNYVSVISEDNAKMYFDSEITISQKYKVTVYATKLGYMNSDVVKGEFTITGNGQATVKGDVDGNGTVNVADHVKLSDIIMGKE
jgi:hypothetical protein